MSTIGEQRHGSITLRDVTAVLFRQRRLLTLSFAGILLLAVVLSGALSPSYEAEMKILVRHGRMDPVVTSQSNTPQQMMQEEITESELNSEVELLNSQDLAAEGRARQWPANKTTFLAVAFRKPNEEVEIAKAVRDLGKHLKAEPLRKTNIISVSLSPPILI